jgi:hypothetical protein
VFPTTDRQLHLRRARAGAIILLTLTFAAGCSGHRAPGTEHERSPTTPAIPAIDAAARLDALGREWRRASGTITYRTTAQVLGQPTTAHLCLRQMFDDDYGEDRTALLRRCSRQGTLRLVWDPPDEWEMDVITPVDRFQLVSTLDGSRRCETGADAKPACRTIPQRRILTATPFGFLLLSPDEVLAEVGASRDAVEASDTTDVNGQQVECFQASGPQLHVEWCFSRDGLLLSFLRGSATDGWTSIDATSVSRPGAD